MISSSRSETIEDTNIQAKISKMKTLYFFLIAISVTLIAHACKTSSVQEVQDNREICRPTFITPDNEEIKLLELMLMMMMMMVLKLMLLMMVLKLMLMMMVM